MENFKENSFVFSPKFRILRHVVFWTVHVLCFSFLWKTPDLSIQNVTILSLVWVPGMLLYSYPVMFWLIPRFLLKEKYAIFILVLFAWAVFGYFLNYFYRTRVYFPLADRLFVDPTSRNPWATGSYLTLNVMAGFGSMIVLFKYWIRKQKEFLTAEKEKTDAELQLLKAQIHPHFLFNTLNNIYSFSMEFSPKTPQMLLQLSSLLSYVLYDCKADQVLLSNELEIMKNYIALEKERYGNRLDISLNMEGEIHGKWIAPLLLLPFLENAFKHGVSEQLEKPWLSMDVSVHQNTFRCKIVNSKNEGTHYSERGIGIRNVQKRLAYLYPGQHDLKLMDEGSFFVASLMLELNRQVNNPNAVIPAQNRVLENINV